MRARVANSPALKPARNRRWRRSGPSGAGIGRWSPGVTPRASARRWSRTAPRGRNAPRSHAATRSPPATPISRASLCWVRPARSRAARSTVGSMVGSADISRRPYGAATGVRRGPWGVGAPVATKHVMGRRGLLAPNNDAGEVRPWISRLHAAPELRRHRRLAERDRRGLAVLCVARRWPKQVAHLTGGVDPKVVHGVGISLCRRHLCPAHDGHHRS